MVALRIRLFGCPAVSLNGGPWSRQATRPAERLLGYLALNAERLHSREKLATLLWEDAAPSNARNALNTTLWRLRQSLEPDGADRGRFLKVGGAGEIGLNFSECVWCDVHAFVSAMCGAEDPPLREIVLGLEGELLEGFYDDWIIAERERMNAARSQALLRLMCAASDAGDCEAALDYGGRILANDPLRESVHRHMMRLYFRLGERTQALRQYDTCARALRRELGVEPMSETRALGMEIRLLDHNATAPVATAPVANAQEIRHAMLRVEDAIQHLSRSHAELATRLSGARPR